MCLSSEVRLIGIGERGEAVGRAVDGPDRPVRVRLDLLVLEGTPVQVGDVVEVDCGLALRVVHDEGSEPCGQR